MDALRPATPMADQLIYESKKSKIYFYEDSEWNKSVLLKLLNYEFPTPRDISQLYNEFDIIEGLGMIGTREALQRLKHKGKHAMYLEWVEGQTVKEAFKGKQEDIRDFLHLAVTMASAEAELHDQNIIHKDISGNNMIVNLQEHWVKIIDFGIASKITLKERHLRYCVLRNALRPHALSRTGCHGYLFMEISPSLLLSRARSIRKILKPFPISP